MRSFSIEDKHAAELLDRITALTGQGKTEVVVRALELYQTSLLKNRKHNGEVNGDITASQERRASSLLAYLNELALRPMSSRTPEEVDAYILAERDAWDE